MGEFQTLGSMYAADTLKLERLFADLPARVQNRVLKAVMRDVTRTVAAAEHEGAPRESGLLDTSLGVSPTRTYRDEAGSSKLFVAVGVRRGYRRTAAVAKRGKVTFLRGSRPERGDPDARNPALYLHLVTNGRKPVEALNGRALHSLNGRFFRHAQAAKANPFIERAYDSIKEPVAATAAAQGETMILAEAQELLHG